MTDFAFGPTEMRAANLIGVFSSLTFNVIFIKVGFRPTILLFAVFPFCYLFLCSSFNVF